MDRGLGSEAGRGNTQVFPTDRCTSWCFQIGNKNNREINNQVQNHFVVETATRHRFCEGRQKRFLTRSDHPLSEGNRLVRFKQHYVPLLVN